MSVRKQLTAAFSKSRALTDSNGETVHHTISIFDVEPAGVVIKAYNPTDSSTYSLGVSEEEMVRAGVRRGPEGYDALAESVELTMVAGEVAIRSSMDAVRDPTKTPVGEDVRGYLEAAAAGDSTLPELLTTGLVELCKVKPVGLDGVRWLGEWLIENNPNTPFVEEPEEDEPAAAEVVEA